MTNEEAIKTLRELWRNTNDHWYEKVYEMAINALKREVCADKSSLVKSDANDEDRTEDDQISRRATIHTVRKIILGFFSDEDGAMTDTEKTLLSVNKAICNALRPQENKQLANNSPKVDSDSGDLISRQTILDALDEIESEVADGEGFLYEKWREYFCDLSPAQPEPHWIPCSERLPEDGKWCLLTDGANMSVERYKADAMDHFFPEGRWFSFEDTVAWMPLPKEYQEDE